MLTAAGALMQGLCRFVYRASHSRPLLHGVLRVQVLTEAYRRGAVQKQRTEAMALKARMEMAKIARMRAAKRKMDAEASTFDRCVGCGMCARSSSPLPFVVVCAVVHDGGAAELCVSMHGGLSAVYGGVDGGRGGAWD